MPDSNSNSNSGSGSDSDSGSDSGSDSRLSPHFRDLNPEEIINAYTAANPGPLTAAIRAILGGLSHTDPRGFIGRIIDTIKDEEFRRQFYEACKEWIKTHPWHIAFFAIAIVLMVNPLALAGFGALGPVVGSIAVAWQSAIGGSVAAGSAFAILQSMGMLGAVIIPAVGAGVFGSTIFAAISESEWVRNLMARLRHLFSG